VSETVAFGASPGSLAEMEYELFLLMKSVSRRLRAAAFSGDQFQ
jgi:hypothetical protein